MAKEGERIRNRSRKKVKGEIGLNLDDLVGLGYRKTKHSFACYEIWGYKSSRVLYNPEDNKVVVEYDLNTKKGESFHKEYVGDKLNG